MAREGERKRGSEGTIEKDRTASGSDLGPMFSYFKLALPEGRDV